MLRQPLPGATIFVWLVTGYAGQRTGFLIAKASVQLLNMSSDSHIGFGLCPAKFKSILVQRKSGTKIVRTP